MKTKSICFGLMLLSVTLLGLSLYSAPSAAQSGRVVPTPTPTPAKPSDVKPKFIPDPQANKYRLIFATGFEDSFLYAAPAKDKNEQRTRDSQRAQDNERRAKSYLDNLTAQLNQAGAQGYQVVSSTRYFHLLRLSESQYEFSVFDTTGKLFLIKSHFEEKYAKLAAQGFSLAEHIFLSRICAPEPDDATTSGYKPEFFEDCTYSDRFLFQRITDTAAQSQFRMVRYRRVPRLGVPQVGEVLTAQLNDHLATGYFPARALSKFEILLRPITANEKPRFDQAEMRVFTGEMRELQKKVNELARQGYRLALAQHGTAVMYRTPQSIAPVYYAWLIAPDKNFEAELTRLTSKGAYYRMTYPDDEYEHMLIFEQPVTSDGKQREYQLLTFELQYKEYAAEKRVIFDLTTPAKESLNTLNRLVKEGFDVRDLIKFPASNKVGALLERTR